MSQLEVTQSIFPQDASLSAAAVDRLFNPRSIALVGATERSIWSMSIFDNLTRFGYRGKLHLVNPKGGTIFGMPAATSCAATGEEIDAALLMVPESKIIEVFDDLKQANVGGAVILSSGFAEVGAEGAVRQLQLTEAGRAGGIRILGPNCLGFANFVANTPMWTTPLRRAIPGGNVAIVSQSGSIANQLGQFAYQQRVALTHMIATGNEADVDVADAIDYLARQPEPRAIAVFLESVRRPQRFVEAVAAASAAGKPVVVLKVGSSEAAARAAQTHTGSLVGDDRTFDALCRQLGISRVRSLEELVVTADLFARLGDVRGDGFALTAMSGGLCEIATDQAEAEGVPLATLSEQTMAYLRDTLPAMATPNNPLDLTGAAMLQPELITQSIAAIADDQAVGLVGFVFDAPLKEDKRGAARNFIKSVGEGFKSVSKPCIMMSNTATSVNGDARALTDEYGVVYSGGGVRLCLTAVGHLLRRGRWQQRQRALAPTIQQSGERPVTEREVLDYLDSRGVPVVPANIVNSAEEAVTAARVADVAVVLKILSPDISHKTEVGGVALNLRGDKAVREGYEKMMASVKAAKPEAKLEGVIVSPMRGAGVELFIGTMREPQWGPAIVVGLGGVWVEALKDTSMRLLPIDELDALEMLGELRGGKLLDGFRGAPPVDRTALARAIVAIGQAAMALGPDLVSLEINPLLASEGRIEALDGLTEWKQPT